LIELSTNGKDRTEFSFLFNGVGVEQWT